MTHHGMSTPINAQIKFRKKATKLAAAATETSTPPPSTTAENSIRTRASGRHCGRNVCMAVINDSTEP